MVVRPTNRAAWQGDFTRSQDVSPARAALRSQSNVAAPSSCAARDGAIAWHWQKYLPVVSATAGEEAK
jgi:hypothetical protein